MANSSAQVLVPVEQRHFLEELYRSDHRDPTESRRVYTYCSGETIWLEPDLLWVVCRGVVQVSMLHPTGDEVLLGLISASMPFGYPLTTLNSYSARALTDVELISFTLSEIEQSPNLTQALFRQIGRRLRQSEAILAISSQRRVEDRLRQLLLLLKQEVGEPTAEGTRLTVRLTHQQLANAIGTSRVTITRLLGKLRADGWVSQDSERYLVIQAVETFA